MFTDGLMLNGTSTEYEFLNGLGYLKGGCCPHFNERRKDFYNKQSNLKRGNWFALENNSAIVFKNGDFVTSLTSGGKSFKIFIDGEKLTEIVL